LYHRIAGIESRLVLGVRIRNVVLGLKCLAASILRRAVVRHPAFVLVVVVIFGWLVRLRQTCAKPFCLETGKYRCGPARKLGERDDLAEDIVKLLAWVGWRRCLSVVRAVPLACRGGAARRRLSEHPRATSLGLTPALQHFALGLGKRWRGIWRIRVGVVLNL
jgi:hypothetical protein